MSSKSVKPDNINTPIITGLEKVTPLRKPVECPKCDNMSSRNTYPFCSKRCADADLGRWFNGTYTIEQ